MIIKSKDLDFELDKSLWRITPNKKKPLIMIGSYGFKPYGSLVTDIDFMSYVIFNDDLIDIVIYKIIERVTAPDSNFIFVDFSCGMYKDFIMPFKLLNTGCEFNYDKTIEWYNNLKTKKILKPETESEIDSIIYKDELCLKDLIDIKTILEPYYDIKWSIKDLYNKKIIDKYDKKTEYDLLDTIKNYKGVLKFLFVYKPDEYSKKDYINIELGLHDKVIEFKRSDIPHFYENWYKIFKGFKWFVLEKYKDEYTNALLKIDYQNALLNRLKSLKKIINYNLLQKIDLDSFKSQIYSELVDKRSGIEKGLLNKIEINDLITLVSNNIINSVKDDVFYFRDKLIPNELVKQNMYFDRALIHGKIKINVNELRNRSKKGIICPFFEIDELEYEFLYNISVDYLLEPNKVIDCFIKICNENNILVKDLIRIKDNFFVLKYNTNNNDIIEIYKREIKNYYKYGKLKQKILENKIYEFNSSKLKYVQKLIINKILGFKAY